MDEVVRSSSPSVLQPLTRRRHVTCVRNVMPCHIKYTVKSLRLSHTPSFQDLKTSFFRRIKSREKTRSRVLIPSMSYCGQRSPSAVMTNDESLWQSDETLVSVIPGHSFHATQATIVTKHEKGAARDRDVSQQHNHVQDHLFAVSK